MVLDRMFRVDNGQRFVRWERPPRPQNSIDSKLAWPSLLPHKLPNPVRDAPSGACPLDGSTCRSRGVNPPRKLL
jgi:hypothetical protein